MAKDLQDQFDKLTNQARFIQMIVNKELVVSNRRKADIVAELRKLGFRPFSKIAKAKAAGDTEAVVEDEEEDFGSAADYDYLMNMAIHSLTKERVCYNFVMIFRARIDNIQQIEKLLQQSRDKEVELLTLLEMTPVQIWNTDLDRFLQEWEVSP